MTNIRTENVTNNVCSVDRCSNPPFAYCIIAPGLFKGRICEECYGNNSPLWREIHDKEIEDFLSKEDK
jgi:hypothetical protein